MARQQFTKEGITMPRKKRTSPVRKNDACPNCGYCPHCGRAEARPVQPVYVPWGTAPYPLWIYPYTYPIYGTAATSVTITNADLPLTGNTIEVTGVTPGWYTTSNLPPGSLTTS